MCLSNAKHYSTVSTKAVSLTAAPSDRRKSSSSAVLTLGEPTRFVHWPGFAPPPSLLTAAAHARGASGGLILGAARMVPRCDPNVTRPVRPSSCSSSTRRWPHTGSIWSRPFDCASTTACACSAAPGWTAFGATARSLRYSWSIRLPSAWARLIFYRKSTWSTPYVLYSAN